MKNLYQKEKNKSDSDILGLYDFYLNAYFQWQDYFLKGTKWLVNLSGALISSTSKGIETCVDQTVGTLERAIDDSAKMAKASLPPTSIERKVYRLVNEVRKK